MQAFAAITVTADAQPVRFATTKVPFGAFSFPDFFLAGEKKSGCRRLAFKTSAEAIYDSALGRGRSPRGVPFPAMGKEPKDRPGHLPKGSPGHSARGDPPRSGGRVYNPSSRPRGKPRGGFPHWIPLPGTKGRNDRYMIPPPAGPRPQARKLPLPCFAAHGESRPRGGDGAEPQLRLPLRGSWRGAPEGVLLIEALS